MRQMIAWQISVRLAAEGFIGKKREIKFQKAKHSAEFVSTKSAFSEKGSTFSLPFPSTRFFFGSSDIGAY